MIFIYFILIFAISYLIGTIPCGLGLGKLFRLKEIPKNLDGYVSFGSLWHSKHWFLAIITLILEISKIIIVTFIIYLTETFHNLPLINIDIFHQYIYDCPKYTTGICSPRHINLFGQDVQVRDAISSIKFFALIVGQIFPCWTRFKGSTGTLFAILFIIFPTLILTPLFTLAFIITWLIVLFFTKYMCLANIISITIWPLIMLIGGFIHNPEISTIINFIPIAIRYIALALLVILGHRGHITRLLKGQEPKFSFKKKNKELKA